jgi:CDGSH-type Zn-finger protein
MWYESRAGMIQGVVENNF